MDAAPVFAFDPRPPARPAARATSAQEEFPAVLAQVDDDRQTTPRAEDRAATNEKAEPTEAKEEKTQSAPIIDLVLLQAAPSSPIAATPIILASAATNGPVSSEASAFSPLTAITPIDQAAKQGIAAASAPAAVDAPIKPSGPTTSPTPAERPQQAASATQTAPPVIDGQIERTASPTAPVVAAEASPAQTSTAEVSIAQLSTAQAAATPAKSSAAPAKQSAAATPIQLGETQSAERANTDQASAAQALSALDAEPDAQTATTAPVAPQAALTQAGAQQQAAAKPATASEEKIKPQKAKGEGEPAAEPGKSQQNGAKPQVATQAVVRQVAPNETPTPQPQPIAHEQTHAMPGADSLGQTGAPSQATQASGQTATAQSPALRAHTAAHLAAQITRRFDAGQTSFEVRLDPAELGRVDVRIDMTRDRRVHATISADSAMTLTELTKASKDLERALAEAGLDLAEGGLNFSLNDPGQRQDFAGNEKQAARSSYGQARERTAAAEDMPIGARPLNISRWAGAGLDVWA